MPMRFMSAEDRNFLLWNAGIVGHSSGSITGRQVMDSEGRVGSSVCHSEVGRDPAKVEVKLSTAVDMVYRLTELDSRPGVFGSGRSVERMVQISTRIDQEEKFDLIEVQFDNIYRLGMT